MAKRDHSARRLPCFHVVERNALRGSVRASASTDMGDGSVAAFDARVTTVLALTPTAYSKSSHRRPARNSPTLPYAASASATPLGSPALTALSIISRAICHF